MKKSIVLIVIYFFCHILNAQSGMWTWIKGPNTGNDLGVSGTMGVPDIANNPEGRYQAANWIDFDGNLWIFGGLDASHSERNDLWRYNPSTNIWTWINGPLTPHGIGIYGTQGIPSPNNIPGARGWGATSWTDKQGRLFLRGGFGYDASGIRGNLDDIWMYDIPSNQWSWMKGSNTVDILPNYGTLQVESTNTTPGGIQENNTAWVKSDGSLWLFGGEHFDTTSALYSFSNDIWRFNINTNNWIWMKGSAGQNINGNYGSLNVESSTNLPPARGTYTRWQDKNDNFYIFGGLSSFSNGSFYNDVWRFNSTTNNWTWISGSNQANDLGNYIQKCSPSVNAFPSARYENRTAQTLGCSDKFWTFGGFTYDSVGALLSVINDFWNFNTSTNEWSWVSGSNTTNSPGNYGVLNVPSPLNDPPPRGGVCLWVLPNGEVLLWGGMNDIALKFNDMWRYIPDTACIGSTLPIIIPLNAQLNDSIICIGDTTSLVVSNGSILSISPSNSTNMSDPTRVILSPTVSTTYTVIANSSCTSLDTFYYNVTVLPRPIASFTITPVGDTLTLGGISVTNTTTMADSNFWYLNNNLVTNINSLPIKETGDYCLQLVTKSKEGCIDTAKQCFYVINSTSLANAPFAIPNAFTPNGDGINDVFYPVFSNNSNVVIKTFHVYNRWGELIYSNPNKGWDGTIKGESQPIESYTYSFVFLIPDAKSPTGTKEIKKIGNFSLLR